MPAPSAGGEGGHSRPSDGARGVECLGGRFSRRAQHIVRPQYGSGTCPAVTGKGKQGDRQ